MVGYVMDRLIWEILFNMLSIHEYFRIIAKKIEGKEKLKRNGCIVFDLDDFNEIC